MQTDYLIIGQGICGTLLSHSLLVAGKRVLVIDNDRPFSSSKVASGLINPVTGKRIVQSWMMDELLPVAVSTYRALEQQLGIPFFSNCNVLEFFPTREEKEMFLKRVEEGNLYLKNAEGPEAWEQYFNFNNGIGEIVPCYLVNLQILLPSWRAFLQQQNSLVEETFDIQQLSIEKGSVRYKDIEAERVVFCTGTESFNNPWFSKLAYTTNKGEALIAEIPGLPGTHIFKHGIKITPWKDGLFWIGASYEWKYDNMGITSLWRKKVEEVLKYWLKLPYTIIDHIVSERPATVDYKPFVGFHPNMPGIGILNGMGSKGCSQAPYFANQLAQHMVYSTPLLADADIKRFSRVLNR